MSSSCSEDSQTLTTTVSGTPAALSLAVRVQAQGTGAAQARQQLLAVTAAGVVAKLPAGTLMVGYWPSALPPGYLLCDGSAVSRTAFAALFTAIGTTWGAGDGSTTFNLPDLRGRTPFGADATRLRLTGTLPNALGGGGGEEFHTVSVAEMLAHDHGLGIGAPIFTHVASGATWFGNVTGSGVQSAANDITWRNSGGGASHENMPPYFVATWVVSV